MRCRSSTPKYSISTRPREASPWIRTRVCRRWRRASTTRWRFGSWLARAPAPRGGGRAAGGARDLLGVAHRELLAHDAVAQVPAPLGVRDLKQGLRVARREALLLDVFLELARQLEQAQVVRDRRAIEAHAPADLVLGPAAVDQRPEGVRELDRVQVAALHVLDQRELEAVAIVDVGDHGGDRGETGRARGAPASLADEQLVAVADAAHHDGLQHTVLFDRIREARERALVEAPARLLGIGIDAIDGDLARRRPRARRGLERRRGGRLRRAAARRCRVRARWVDCSSESPWLRAPATASGGGSR